jgi:hypothetical protein
VTTRSSSPGGDESQGCPVRGAPSAGRSQAGSLQSAGRAMTECAFSTAAAAQACAMLGCRRVVVAGIQSLRWPSTIDRISARRYSWGGHCPLYQTSAMSGRPRRLAIAGRHSWYEGGCSVALRPILDCLDDFGIRPSDCARVFPRESPYWQDRGRKVPANGVRSCPAMSGLRTANPLSWPGMSGYVHQSGAIGEIGAGVTAAHRHDHIRSTLALPQGCHRNPPMIGYLSERVEEVCS